MFREIIFLYVASLLANQVMAQKWGLGGCPDFSGLTAVNITQYFASPWYYNRTITNFIEAGNRCSKETLTDVGQPSPSGDKWLSYKIDARRGNAPVTLKARICLNKEVTGGLELVRANYGLQALIPFVPILFWTLVDYNSWTIVYACQEVLPGILHYKLGWLKTRSPTTPLTDAQTSAITEALAPFDLTIDDFDHIEDQTNCPSA